jgi:DNA-binding response OmpR family regulator
MKKILLIEDDEAIAKLVQASLATESFEVDWVSDGTKGYEMVDSNVYSLLILDLGLPGMSGTEICSKVRRANENIPIIILTSRSEEIDKVLGLELGADDYMTKPFSVRELVARINSLLRRAEFVSASREKTLPNEISFRGLELNLDQRLITIEGKAIPLTAVEFDLLAYLAQRPGKVFDREHLLKNVWGYQSSSAGYVVNSHMSRLRAKIEKDPENPIYIKTVRGVGYAFEA